MNLSELKEMFIEIGDYLYYRYFCLDLSQYHNFSLGAKNTLIPKIVMSFVIGAMIGIVLMYLEKKQTTKLVRALLQDECKDQETAKSAEELQVRMSKSLIRRMRKPSPLSKLVFYRGQKAPVATSLLLQKASESSETEKTNKIEETEEAKNVSDNQTPSDTNKMEENGSEKQYFYPTRAAMIRERKAVDFKTVPLYIPTELSYRADVRYGTTPKRWACILSVLVLPIFGFIVLRMFPTILVLADGMISFLK